MHPVVEALCRPEAYPHPADKTIQLVETHISWVFLTGRFAYKLKKPVNLGFLDFSTLEKRLHCCREELRLNRRLCPEIYLNVLPVVRAGDTYLVGADGLIVDYAVQMVQFDRNLELDRLLTNNDLTTDQIDQISSIVAAFHSSIPPAHPATDFGKPEILIVPVLENFTHTERILSTPEEISVLENIKAWSIGEYHRLHDVFLERKARGFVRQCHGDMHTGNMVLWKDRIVIFDCIEFNPNLSVIDIISDFAFLFMDLQHSGKRSIAWRVLNDYLSITGDYEGLQLLRFYCTYRAMVRAKVTAIRFLQETDSESRTSILNEHTSYVQLALEYTSTALPTIMLTCGVSGSGKTTFSRQAASRTGSIHIRSDIERKRLFGLHPLEKSRSLAKTDIYSCDATERTYARLLEIAGLCLSNGYTVIVDATFIRTAERETFIHLAEKAGRRCRILCFAAPDQVLRARVEERSAKGTDASEADTSVLEAQLLAFEPLSDQERKLTVVIDTTCPQDIDAVMHDILRNDSSP
jgi:aminoglycoside phosphotransferase family enzyme/predicted kinase